jgi:hypothetical protein
MGLPRTHVVWGLGDVSGGGRRRGSGDRAGLTDADAALNYHPPRYTTTMPIRPAATTHRSARPALLATTTNLYQATTAISADPAGNSTPNDHGGNDTQSVQSTAAARRRPRSPNRTAHTAVCARLNIYSKIDVTRLVASYRSRTPRPIREKGNHPR